MSNLMDSSVAIVLFFDISFRHRVDSESAKTEKSSSADPTVVHMINALFCLSDTKSIRECCNLSQILLKYALAHLLAKASTNKFELNPIKFKPGKPLLITNLITLDSTRTYIC